MARAEKLKFSRLRFDGCCSRICEEFNKLAKFLESEYPCVRCSQFDNFMLVKS